MNTNKIPNLPNFIPEKKTLAVIAAVVLVLVIIGVYSHREAILSQDKKSNEPQPAFVKVETVTADKTIRDSIIQNTSIEAVDRVELLPRVTGRLERLNVSKGDIVKAGQIVATLEHDQQNALIGSTQAQTASAKAETERAKAEMMNAKANLDRYERLVKEGFSTQQQYEAIKTTYTSAKASHNAALAKERQAAAELGRVISAQKDYIMAAPFDGTVLNDYSLTQGAMISPNSPIMDIANLRRLKATLKIPEVKIFAVKPGMPVFIRFDALPGEEFEGSITMVDPYVDQSTRTSNVEIELDNKTSAGGRLRPGMFGQASIVEKELKNTIVIPESALHSSENGHFVFVVRDGVAKLKNVSTGIRQGATIQITKGLEPGEHLIIFGGNNLNDGEKVTVQNQ